MLLLFSIGHFKEKYFTYLQVAINYSYYKFIEYNALFKMKPVAPNLIGSSLPPKNCGNQLGSFAENWEPLGLN